MKGTSWWLIAVWAVSFTLLVLNAAVSTYNVEVLIANDRAVDRSRDIKKAISDVLSAVKDAETGHRGFQVTGDDSYLEPYRSGEIALLTLLPRLDEVTAADPFHQSHVANLHLLVARRFDEFRMSITLRGLFGRDAARDYMMRGEGKRIMDQLRAVVAEMDAHEEQILAERSRISQERYKSATYSTLFGGLITILMVAMAFVVVRKELMRRQEAENVARSSAENLARSQSETAETLALLDAFLKNAPIGMAFLDADLKYLRVNDRLAAANALPGPDHVSRKITEVVKEIAPEVVSDLHTVLATGEPILERKVTGRPAAPNRVWHSSYFPVKTTTGKAIGIGEVTKDVTEELAAEARLRESEQRKSAILETALDCVISIDHEGKIVEFNPAAEQTFGYSRGEAMNQELATLIVPAVHREDHRRGLAHYLATGEGPVLNRRIRLPAIRKDGTEFPSELAITAIATDGRPTFTAYLRDITEQVRAEESLRASESRYRTLAEAIPQMVWNSDPDGRVSYFNRRMTEYTGLSPADTVESWWIQVTHPDDAERLQLAWQRAVSAQPEPFELEVRVRDVHDGSYHWFLTAVVPLRRPDGTVDHWIGSLSSIDEQKRQSEILASLVRMRTSELESTNDLLREEITERARAESRATAAAVELGRSNEELEKFAYVASHDLQEPLRKIQAFGDRLVKRFRESLGQDGQEYVERMHHSAARMRTLIDDLLTFSRVTTKGQPFGKVDLNTIVAEVISDLEVRIVQAGGHVELGELPEIVADPPQMRQLFQNLIGNALKFHKTDEKPVVTVRSTHWSQLPAHSDPPAPTGIGYRIVVSDNGIGFNPAFADKIFEVFQRLHGRSHYEGTGIGLAICRKIVQRHGGDIAARSEEGQGAAFIVDLPATAD
jgi:PAS domain S-box-containing protein